MRERQEQDRLQELVETAWEKDLRDEEAQAIALLSLNVPDYWFVYGRYLGIGVGWRLGTAALLATLAGWSGIRLRRLLSDQPIRSSSGPRPSRHPDQSPPEC
jgi:hypothetical protein